MDQLEQSRIQVPKKLHSVKTQRLCLKQRFYSFLFRFQEQRAMLENETLRRQALLYIYIFFFLFAKSSFICYKTRIFEYHPIYVYVFG